MSTTPVKLETCTGTLLSVLVPLPSCPILFNPKVQTVLSLFSTIECPPPAATLTTPLREDTFTGTLLSVLFPLPRAPQAFLPQELTMLLEQTASEWYPPAAITCALTD